MDTTYDCRGVPGDGAPSRTQHRMDELRSIDDGQGPHPPLWWIISGEDQALCYVTVDTVRQNGTHRWVTEVWNDQGVREHFSEQEWATARLEALAQPVRPQTEIQDVILASIEEEVITPRCGIELYRETLEGTLDQDRIPAQTDTSVSGEVRHE